MRTIGVSVVYALPDAATEVELRLPAGSTVAEALLRSGLAGRHPEIDLEGCALGVFGKRVDRAFVLSDGDRVEIYRPLIADPKDSRRRRAARAKRP